MVLLCWCSFASAQEKTTKDDSTKVYKKIEKYAKKNNFRQFVHKLLFTTPESATPKKRNKLAINKKKIYAKNAGKIIRKINIPYKQILKVLDQDF